MGNSGSNIESESSGNVENGERNENMVVENVGSCQDMDTSSPETGGSSRAGSPEIERMEEIADSDEEAETVEESETDEEQKTNGVENKKNVEDAERDVDNAGRNGNDEKVACAAEKPREVLNGVEDVGNKHADNGAARSNSSISEFDVVVSNKNNSVSNGSETPENVSDVGENTTNINTASSLTGSLNDQGEENAGAPLKQKLAEHANHVADTEKKPEANDSSEPSPILNGMGTESGVTTKKVDAVGVLEGSKDIGMETDTNGSSSSSTESCNGNGEASAKIAKQVENFNDVSDIEKKSDSDVSTGSTTSLSDVGAELIELNAAEVQESLENIENQPMEHDYSGSGEIDHDSVADTAMLTERTPSAGVQDIVPESVISGNTLNHSRNVANRPSKHNARLKQLVRRSNFNTPSYADMLRGSDSDEESIDAMILESVLKESKIDDSPESFNQDSYDRRREYDAVHDFRGVDDVNIEGSSTAFKNSELVVESIGHGFDGELVTSDDIPVEKDVVVSMQTPTKRVDRKGTSVNIEDPLSIDVCDSDYPDEITPEKIAEEIDNLGDGERRAPSNRSLLGNIPKPKHFRNLNASEAGCSSSFGLYADSGSFIRDDEPGTSHRPSRKAPRDSSYSPPIEPPHAPYMDSDYQLALKLQEEEDNRARRMNRPYPSTSYQSTSYQSTSTSYQSTSTSYQSTSYQSTSDCVIEQYPLSPIKFSKVDDNETPAVPPGSPKGPEEAAMTSVTYTDSYTVVQNPLNQDLPTDINKNETSTFGQLVPATPENLKRIPLYEKSSTYPYCEENNGSAPSEQDDPQESPSGRNGSSSGDNSQSDTNRRGPFSHYHYGPNIKPSKRLATRTGKPEPKSSISNAYSQEEEDDDQPGTSNSYSHSHYYNDSQPGTSSRDWNRPGTSNQYTPSYNSNQPGTSSSYSQYDEPGTSSSYDPSQPGTSNSYDDFNRYNSQRRTSSRQAEMDEEADFQRALELSRIEHQNMLRRQSGLEEMPIPEESSTAAANDDALFRVPETPRKRKMNPLSDHHEYSPASRRHATQSFYAVETFVEMEEPEISSSTIISADSKWPLCKWLDPENMPELETIDPIERRKMPLTYVKQIKMEHEKKKRMEESSPLAAKKEDFQLDFEREAELEKKLLEDKFMEIARSHITAPCIVPVEIADTRFEVYLRFSFLPRPIFVHHVLRALNTPEINGSWDDRLEGTPPNIREMSVGEFFKYAVYTWFGLKLDSSATDNSLNDLQIEVARDRFFEKVKTRLEEEALLQEDEEERKCAESMVVSHVHACTRTDVNRDDIKEMQVFKKKAMEKRQVLDRHRQRYGISNMRPEMESPFREPACIRREKALLQAAAQGLSDAPSTSDENEAPVIPALNLNFDEEDENGNEDGEESSSTPESSTSESISESSNDVHL